VSAHLEEDFVMTFATNVMKSPMKWWWLWMTKIRPSRSKMVLSIWGGRCEHVALALDPFPRAANATFDGGDEPEPQLLAKPPHSPLGIFEEE